MRQGVKRSIAMVAGVALVALVARHPTADVRLVTHDPAEPAPHRMQAAIDLGVIGVSVLYTWSVDQLR